MGIVAKLMRQAEERGYSGVNATAKICQDIILKAIAESDLSRNVTIKGGVVMREITNDIRRATQDMDIDFIRYSLNDDSIDSFISRINVLDGVVIQRIGIITELSQQDYHGKRVNISVTDSDGVRLQSKIDFGVHTHLAIEQEEFCFEVGIDDEGVSLLINSKEQMFTEKLRSLLKFGSASTRYKDIFDMYYLSSHISIELLKDCIDEYIINDPGMKEDSQQDIINRLMKTFSNKRYLNRLSGSDKNWLKIDPETVLSELLDYLRKLNDQN